jgi:predicted nuclease of predicted toxin-antitoxin system
MKLLLDENLPKKLKLDFADHEIYTVSDKKWNSKKNGELLKLMLKEAFDVLFTFDKNLQYQQNFEKYPITVIVLNAEDNAYITLKELVPQIREILSKELPKGPIEIKARA